MDVEPVPDGLLAVPFGKGCTLLLTPREVTAGIKRGKWWRRRRAMLARERKGDAAAPAPGTNRP